MSALKRKTATEVGVSKSSNKRQKAEVRRKDVASKSAKNKDQPEQQDLEAKTTSILVKEQPAFPRGGAGLLTPLERKQIQAKATRDAIAEQKQPNDLFGSKHGESPDSDTEDLSEEDLTEETRSKKKGKKGKKQKSSATQQESRVAIEGLSFKRLAVGSVVLGAISSINSQDLTIALPNNLYGFVPLTAISDGYTAKLKQTLESDTNESDEETSDDSDRDVSLTTHFREGQLVRAVVTSLGDDATGKAQTKKRIELSLEPSRTNTRLTKSALTTGATIQASISSVEDHGLVLDLGLVDESSTKGFVPAKSLDTPLSSFKTGATMLCTITESSVGKKVLKLTPGLSDKITLKNAPSVDAFLPGTLVEVLVSEIAPDGLAGKIIGMIDATADIVHSGSYQDRESFEEKYKIGQKIKGRLISTFALSDKKKLAFSVLENLVHLHPIHPKTGDHSALQTSSIIDAARVIRVAPGLGVFLSLPSQNVGFAHISRLSDKRVDSVGETLGAYKLNSEHRARILDYNPLDDLYVLSLQKTIIEQKFLRIEDVSIGEVVHGAIEKLLIGAHGVQGLIVTLADGISALVPQIHLSDITLLHPEKKFREGGSVTARVLSVDKIKRQIRLTLKKTLVNGDHKMWSDIEEIEVGDTTVGTLIKVDSRGAIVQFYGQLRGYLPVSEMSEAYIKDATEHFKVGQVLSVNAISVNPEERRLTVSCRERSVSSETSLHTVVPGTLVSGTVFEKSQGDLLMRLEEAGVIARLALDHVSDGSERKRRSALEKIRVGQRLENVLVLDIQRKGRLVNLSNKSTLIKAAQNGQFLKGFEYLKENAILTGYISNITSDGIFVRFADGISGMIPKHQVPQNVENQPDFDMQTLQAVTARVTSIDYRGATPRFWLTMREGTVQEAKVDSAPKDTQIDSPKIVNPVDDTISSFADFSSGKVTKARISSVKDTQINVELAKDIQGRIDVSEVFDGWEQIKDRKQPLKTFSQKQVLDVRILGVHDTRNHRFLPLSHRSGKNTVFELSAKASVINSPEPKVLSMSEMQPGSSWVAYVNNVAQDHLMVNISPSVRGRIKAIDVSDDITLARDLGAHFPVGSAIRVKVISVDMEKNHLDLTGKSTISQKPLDIEELAVGMILPGRVTRISDRSLLVQLSEHLVGAVDLIDMADDYDQSDVAKYQKNDIVRVAVLKIDVANKKVVLSTRPSKVLSSSLKVTDPEITSPQQLNVNDVVRGFITNVIEKGIFVMLGHGVSAFVPVRHLSDLFLKNWKDGFQRDQLVKGKVILADKDSGHIQLSLKESILNAKYKPPLSMASMEVGAIVTGKVVKVETFGVFILVDNSENVRGLCHRSQIAEGNKISDPSAFFKEGDVVKAKVLKIDIPNRRINFGMKASYFAEDEDEDEPMSDAEDTGEIDMEDAKERSSVSSEVDGGVEVGTGDLDDLMSDASDDSEDDAQERDSSEDESQPISKKLSGLSVGGFDWYGMPASTNTTLSSLQDSTTVAANKKKRKNKTAIEADLTADLDTNGPQSPDDFERLLLGSPSSSLLWLQYMAFNLELGDVDAARSIGNRALNTMGLGQDTEKLHVWIGLLNLENVYGDGESIESTFKRACDFNDPQEIYTRLTSIYIQSGKHQKADELFQEMLKKFTQDPKIYINYASFLFDTMKDADKGRALLSRALQVLPPFTHFDLTSKFAQLEFKSDAGLAERGRTIFEGLMNSFPKRIDLFNVMLDMEMKHAKEATNNTEAAVSLSEDSKQQIRDLFQRIFDKKLKPKQAKYFFKRWLSFEEEQGDERKVDEVKSRAARWVKQSGSAE